MLEPETMEVNEVASPTTDEGVIDEQSSAQVESPTTEEEKVAEPVSEQTYETPDDRPWKNKYMEKERKFEELTESLPTLIEEAVKKASSKVEEKPKYTISQLEQYAIENPEYRPWVEEQKEVLRQEQIVKAVESRYENERKQMQEQQIRSQAFGIVQNNYPDLFVKDNAGNVRWKENSPIVGQIAKYMKDPELSRRPDGLVIASKLAYADYYQNNVATLATKTKLAESSLKKEQRKNMVGGTGVNGVQEKDNYTEAMERLRNKGDKASAANAIKEILKSKGMIKE